MLKKFCCTALAVLVAAAACFLPTVLTASASAAVPTARISAAERSHLSGTTAEPQFLGALAKAVGDAVLAGFTGAVGGALYKAVVGGEVVEVASSSSSCATNAKALLRLERPSDAQFNAALR